MYALIFNEALLNDLKEDVHCFSGKSIDISKAPTSLSTHLNASFSKSFGVTKKQMAVQLAEGAITEIATKAKIKVVCFIKDQVRNEPKIIEQFLSLKWIVLLK